MRCGTHKRRRSTAGQPQELFFNFVESIFGLVDIIDTIIDDIIDIQAENTPPGALAFRALFGCTFETRIAASRLYMALCVVASPPLPSRNRVTQRGWGLVRIRQARDSRPHRRPGRARIFGTSLAQSQWPAFELLIVESAQGFASMALITEFDEGKASSFAGLPIDREKNV
jgi:hypothetical protein